MNRSRARLLSKHLFQATTYDLWLLDQAIYLILSIGLSISLFILHVDQRSKGATLAAAAAPTTELLIHQ